MSQQILRPSPINLTQNYVQNFPISSNATVNERLNLHETNLDSDAYCCQLKSILKKPNRRQKKTIWSEYLKNRTKKNVKFHSVTKMMWYDYETKGFREVSCDLLTDVIQHVRSFIIFQFFCIELL